MNIFHLDKDPLLCAKYHCDKHVVKMILETGQMLCTAYQRHYGLKLDQLLYQYTMRYNKVHKTFRIYLLLNSKYKKWQDMEGDFINPPLCMPDEYKLDDYVQSYKNYYIGEKMYFAKYNYSETPYWLKEVINEKKNNI